MIVKPKLYILGASCSGVSTLGEALSERLKVPQIDIDDFYWMPTERPFSVKRDPEDRVLLISQRQQKGEGWVLTGSFIEWGDRLIQDVNMIIFIYTPTKTRLARLDQPEARRHGSRIVLGGDMHISHLDFRDWASRYDDPLFSGRNRAQHAQWLEAQSAPVLRINGECDIEELVRTVEDVISQMGVTPGSMKPGT